MLLVNWLVLQCDCCVCTFIHRRCIEWSKARAKVHLKMLLGEIKFEHLFGLEPSLFGYLSLVIAFVNCFAKRKTGNNVSTQSPPSQDIFWSVFDI